jgi:ABC-type branched-subunit amino acid transport system permease subunit
MADPQTQGVLVELNAIAAAVVGGCRLQGGVGTISGVVLGCFFLRTVTDAVAKVIKGSANLYEGIVVGIVVVVAVAFSQARSAGQHRKQFFQGALGWIAILTLALLAAALGAAFGGRWPGQLVGSAVLLLTLAFKFMDRISTAKAKSPVKN